MFTRRRFLHTTALSSVGILFKRSNEPHQVVVNVKDNPVVIATWGDNVTANAAAWGILGKGGRSIDAVEAGVQVPEADPTDQSVGYGGLPDSDGKVTLDACIMDENGNCGSVMALEYIMHPISVARLVMEKTPHVQLAGGGALQFALANGFKMENLLTPEAERAWREWLKTSKYDPNTIPDLLKEKSSSGSNVPGQINNHDTIGMIAMDTNGT